MSWLFEQCYSLKTIIGLDTWDVSNVTDMNGIFAEVWELTTLNISNWSLNSELHTADFMFYHNFELDTIIMNNSDSDSVNRIISELPTRPSDSTGVLNIAGIDDMSQVDAITVQTKYWNIYDNLVATYIFNSSTDTLPTFNSEFTYVYTDIDNGDGTITRTITSDSSPSSISFSDKTGLVGVSYLDTSNLTNMQSMFYGCSSLTVVDLSGWDTTNVTTIETMFAYCSNLLTVVGLNDLDVSNVENMGGLFSDCSNITEINVSDWDVSKVTNFGAVFRRCPKLAIIDVSKWNTSSGVIMSGIFTNDSSLIELDLSNWDMSHADSVSQMFYGCSALMKLKMCANLNQDAVTTYWFGKCNSLLDIQLSDFDTYTINKVIDELPTKTANDQGSLIVPKIDNSINTSDADSKYWIIAPDSTNIRHMHLDDMVISNLYIGEVEIKKVCLGEIIVYENKQAATNKDTLYNEFTGTLFILKEEALSYDEKELTLNINSDIINVSYNEENLDIGGDK
jgi:surface protein